MTESTKHYDVAVIGSGGGTKIVKPAADLGLSVALVEKGPMGGTCLNRGCIPSKMLIHPADQVHHLRGFDRINVDLSGPAKLAFSELVARVSETVDGISKGIEPDYDNDPRIDRYEGAAQFVAPRTLQVGQSTFSADRMFIATGSRPRIPDIPGLAGTPYLTSKEALRNPTLPKTMLVIGAGFIACELGHVYSTAGTDVTFLIRSQILRTEDKDIRRIFRDQVAKHTRLLEGFIPVRVEYENNRFRVTVEDSTGAQDVIEAEALLVAAGVVPETDELGLENTGIQVDEQGYIVTDDCLQTTETGVYALGDCNGRHFFRHTVNFEGEYLMRTQFPVATTEPIRYGPVPHAVFTYPQIAGVGATEDELIAEGVRYVAGTADYANTAMGMARQVDHGLVKVLISLDDDRILGAHIVGEEASDMLHLLIGLMYKDGTLDDLLGLIYIHPALPEVVRDAGRDARQKRDSISSG